MRVIAGRYKGRILKTVPDNSVRPATDKVKGAIFNIMQSRIDWSQSIVLDLYAGSGSIGIEALSRGAKKTTFVENSKNALKYLKLNLESIAAEGTYQIVLEDVNGFLESVSKKYNVVFADPPYAIEHLEALPNKIFKSKVIAENGYLIMEHPAHCEFIQDVQWVRAVHKIYGHTSISFFRHKL